MKRVFIFIVSLTIFPSAAISEEINLSCRFGLSAGMSLVLDREAGEIGISGASGIVTTRIPYREATDTVLIAFWVTGDGLQFMSLSLNIVTGEASLARVGTKEPMLRQGSCIAEN